MSEKYKRLLILFFSFALLTIIITKQASANLPQDQTGLASTTQQSLQQEQLLPPNPPGMPDDLPMHSLLYETEKFALENNVDSIQTEANDFGLQASLDNKIQVEIIGPEGEDATIPTILDEVGADVTNTWHNRIEAWVPVHQLTAVANELPPDYFMNSVFLPDYDEVVGEGPAVTNADTYIDNNRDCDGLTIAVIDGGFDNLTEARANGDAPTLANSTLINYTSTSFEGSGTHGTGAVEALFDYCEDATWRLYKIDSITDMGVATSDARNNGVDVYSHSLSRYNTGWADNTGAACSAATNAVNGTGALFFTSAGNRAFEHWQGNVKDDDGDSWHEWSSVDETINIEIPNNGGGNFYLSWNTAAGTYNFNLYLYDDDLNLLASSTNTTGNAFEQLYWRNFTGSTQTVHIAVSRVSGGATELELFAHNTGGQFEYTMASGSTTSPSNCTHSNIISVGAVPHSDYTSGQGSDVIRGYSSRGPSNSGMRLPDISGPTDTTGFTYPGGYGGTSSATPNAAGAAAAFWSSDTTLTASSIRYLLFEQARIFNDWGASGPDNTYGYGGIHVHDFHAGTRWVDRRFNNLSGSSIYPYYYVTDAQNAAPINGRIVFIGQSYPELITLTKPLIYESIGYDATLGD